MSDLANSAVALRDTLLSAAVILYFQAYEGLRADVAKLPLWNHECSPLYSKLSVRKSDPSPHIDAVHTDYP